MKYLNYFLIFIFFISVLNFVNLKKGFEENSSNKFIAQFLRGMGDKHSVSFLSRKADIICPKFGRENIFSKIIHRISRIKSGLKKLKKLREKSSRKKRKYYRYLGKVHIISLLRDIFQRIYKCSLVYIKIAKKIESFLKTTKEIVHKKCIKDRKCKMISIRKLNRIYRFFNYNIDYAKGKNVKKTLNRKNKTKKQKGKIAILKQFGKNNKLKRISRSSKSIAQMLAKIVKTYTKKNKKKTKRKVQIRSKRI